MSTLAGTSLRATTSVWGIASEQSWLDQIRSSPEVIFTTRVSGDTVQVQAGLPVVVTFSRRCTTLPAYATSLIFGVTTTSSLRQGPVGTANGVLVFFGFRSFLPRFVSPYGWAFAVERGGCIDWDGSPCAPTTRAGSPSVGSAVPPSSCATPNTRPSATTSTSVRRTQ